jgi:metal-responsive CopG/Arc/MetJ family transcriptional regulator
MNTLTIKLPFTLDDELSRLAQREHLSKSEVVRQALSAYVLERNSRAPASAALDAVSDLVGCFSGGPADLASNPAHLADFGKR